MYNINKADLEMSGNLYDFQNQWHCHRSLCEKKLLLPNELDSGGLSAITWATPLGLHRSSVNENH